ncbi:Insulin-induced gene 2 protein [Exaiptasia diaphana]|nr:Insulin-induced gene 2 protein [Exaiptasia diaphana]
MHCFLCGKQTRSAGQFLIHMYRKIAPTTVNTVVRGIVLFLIGGFLAMVLFALSILPEAQKRRLGSFPIEIIIRVYSTFWWIPPSCGTMAATIGLACPGLDSWLGKPHNFQREWSSVARCVAMFVGISHGTAKLDFSSSYHLFVFMAITSILLWWFFDRSILGLGIAATSALAASVAVILLLYLGVWILRYRQVLAVVPGLFFSGAVTFGNIGRQLAMVESIPRKYKEHFD